jgi:hypothetical protein
MNDNDICQCGIDEQTWVAFDLPCVGDDCHIWETQDLGNAHND